LVRVDMVFICSGVSPQQLHSWEEPRDEND
jgi:hypothetical protein